MFINSFSHRQRKQLTLGLAPLALVVALIAHAKDAVADTFNVTTLATDPIFLAGRTDVTIAPPGTPPVGYVLVRNVPVGPVAETFPKSVPAATGASYQFTVTGTVDYNTVNNIPTLGPDGESSIATINSLGGISAYRGPVGGFVGVFLDATNPAAASPPSLIDFSVAGSTTFTTLSPNLDQVFFIGDGLKGTGSGIFQTFFAPAGATRLFLGIVDGRTFTGAPGAYDDNAGSFNVTVNVSNLPEPASLALLGIGAAPLLAMRSKRKRPA